MTGITLGRQLLPRPVRVGVVSFLNTLPLIDGLDNLPDLELRHTVPSLLMDKLLADEVDLALCSSIDYQRAPVPMIIVPCGLLGCDGSTLTVRLYSSRRPSEIQEVYCDTDSHSSVVLMRILLKELFAITPRLVDYNARERVADNRPIGWPPSMLLIGDKVVTDSPPAIRYPHQLDLGAVWVEHTGYPFVFALWMAKRGCPVELISTAAAILDRQRRHNCERLDRIIHRHGVSRGWPVDLAGDYVKNKLAFEFTDARRRGLELFFDKACEHGLVKRRRPLELAEV